METFKYYKNIIYIKEPKKEKVRLMSLEKHIKQNIVKITVEQIFEDNEGECTFNYYLDDTDDLIEILSRTWYKGEKIERNNQYYNTITDICDNMDQETFTKIKQEVEEKIDDERSYAICMEEQNRAYYSDRL